MNCLLKWDDFEKAKWKRAAKELAAPNKYWDSIDLHQVDDVDFTMFKRMPVKNKDFLEDLEEESFGKNTLVLQYEDTPLGYAIFQAKDCGLYVDLITTTTKRDFDVVSNSFGSIIMAVLGVLATVKYKKVCRLLLLDSVKDAVPAYRGMGFSDDSEKKDDYKRLGYDSPQLIPMKRRAQVRTRKRSPRKL